MEEHGCKRCVVAPVAAATGSDVLYTEKFSVLEGLLMLITGECFGPSVEEFSEEKVLLVYRNTKYAAFLQLKNIGISAFKPLLMM